MNEYLGVCSGKGSPDEGCGFGPATILHPNQLLWHRGKIKNTKDAIVNICLETSTTVNNILSRNNFPVVIGGDHSCAIGTWNGVYQYTKSPFGLLWIDAHMDAHTFDTTTSNAIHGMPLACLLGYGDKSLAQLTSCVPVLDSSRVCVFGARSYERGEAELLERLNVRVITMKEIGRRGVTNAFNEAIEIVSSGGTEQYGITVDIDGFDPTDAPGVGTPSDCGLYKNDILPLLRRLPKPLALEIVEYNPFWDKNGITRELVIDLMQLWHK